MYSDAVRFAQSPRMSIETTYSQARAQLATLMNRVSDDREVVIVKRREQPLIGGLRLDPRRVHARQSVAVEHQQTPRGARVSARSWRSRWTLKLPAELRRLGRAPFGGRARGSSPR